MPKALSISRNILRLPSSIDRPQKTCAGNFGPVFDGSLKTAKPPKPQIRVSEESNRDHRFIPKGLCAHWHQATESPRGVPRKDLTEKIATKL